MDGVLQNAERPLTPKIALQKEQTKALPQADKASLSVSSVSSTVHASIGSTFKKETLKSFSEKLRETAEQQRIDVNGNFSESYIYKRMQDEAHSFDLRASVLVILTDRYSRSSIESASIPTSNCSPNKNSSVSKSSKCSCHYDQVASPSLKMAKYGKTSAKSSKMPASDPSWTIATGWTLASKRPPSRPNVPSSINPSYLSRPSCRLRTT